MAATVCCHGSDPCGSNRRAEGRACPAHAVEVDAMPARPAFAAPGAEVTDELHGDNIGAALAHGVIQPPADGLVSLLAQRGGYGSTQYGSVTERSHVHSHLQRLVLACDCLLLGGNGRVKGLH